MNKLFAALTVAGLGTILFSISGRAACESNALEQRLAFDRAGNLFEASGREIFKLTPDGTKSTFASGLGTAFQLAFDGAGNLFVGDGSSHSIFKFTPEGKKSTFATGLDADAIVFDGAGNLFVADDGRHSIFKFAPDGAKNTFATFNSCFYMALDRAGNLFAGDWDSTSIFKFAPDGSRSTFATGIIAPKCLVFDRSGNLFVVDGSRHWIFKFAPDGAKSTFATGIDGVKGLLFDRSGNLVVPVASNVSGRAIFKFTPEGIKSAFASWLNPDALVFDDAGNLFVLAKGSIFKLAPDGTETTFASGQISPDNQWDYQYSSDGARAGIVKAGTNDVALDLTDECPGSVDWSPDSKRFAFNCRLGGRSNGGASLYQLRGDKWKTLKSPNDDVHEILNKAIAAQVKKRGLPKKTDLRLIWETVRVRRWVDSNTAVLYAGLEEAVRENLDEAFGAHFLVTLKFDDAGKWKIVKTHQMSEKEVEEEQ